MTKSTKIGIALLGAGRMAKVHAVAILNTDASIVSIYDPVEEAGKSLAQETGACFCASAEEAIDRSDVDAVLIASSVGSHTEYIKLGVAKGKRVMCEKPMAETYEAARALYNFLGNEAKRVFMAFNRRFDPGHQKLHDMVRSGKIGDVTQLVLHSRDPALPPREYIRTSGGQFRDMMVHNLDLSRWLFGEEPNLIFATGSAVFEEWVAEEGDVDCSAAILTTPSGKLANISEARVSSFGFDQRLEVYGTKGMLLSDNPTQTPLKYFGSNGADDHYISSDRLKTFFLERYQESYTNEIEAFVEIVRQDRDAPVNVYDGLRAAYLAEAATISNKTGKPVKLNEHSTF